MNMKVMRTCLWGGVLMFGLAIDIQMRAGVSPCRMPSVQPWRGAHRVELCL
jgi:hypothetical protein